MTREGRRPSCIPTESTGRTLRFQSAPPPVSLPHFVGPLPMAETPIHAGPGVAVHRAAHPALAGKKRRRSCRPRPRWNAKSIPRWRCRPEPEAPGHLQRPNAPGSGRSVHITLFIPTTSVSTGSDSPASFPLLGHDSLHRHTDLLRTTFPSAPPPTTPAPNAVESFVSQQLYGRFHGIRLRFHCPSDLDPTLSSARNKEEHSCPSRAARS